MIAKISAEHKCVRLVISADVRVAAAGPDVNQRSSGARSVRPLVELIGIEPTTPCLQSRCSPS